MKLICDMASEVIGLAGYNGKGYIKKEISGRYGLNQTEIQILTDYCSKRIGKSKGKYIEILFDGGYESNVMQFNYYVNVIATSINKMLTEIVSGEEIKCLVVGLGNDRITVDSFGKKSVENTIITRKKNLDKVREVSSYSLGVVSETGIESIEVVKGLIKEINPSVVICIDSLMSYDYKKIGRVIQITDTGIVPSSGVTRGRFVMNKKTLSVPVIAIGVPLATDIGSITGESSKEEKTGFALTPYKIDIIIESLSKLVGVSISYAINPILGIDLVKDLIFGKK